MRDFPASPPLPSLTGLRILALVTELRAMALPLVFLHRAGAELVGAWCREAGKCPPALGGSLHQSLTSASMFNLGARDSGLLLDGVHVPNIAMLCGELDIPCHVLPDFAGLPAAAAAKGLGVDMILSAGFAEVPPANLRAAPVRGWLNLHPSLLPAHGGPDPTFWELRGGEEQIGVSVHYVGPNLWDGAVLAQEAVTCAPLATYHQRLGAKLERGAHLLVQAIAAACSNGKSGHDNASSPFDSEPAPADADWFLTPDMTCSSINTFVAGFREMPRVMVKVDEAPNIIEGIVNAVPGRRDNEAPGSTARLGRDRVKFCCADGWVTLVIQA